jgi:hypothetical protein
VKVLKKWNKVKNMEGNKEIRRIIRGNEYKRNRGRGKIKEKRKEEGESQQQLYQKAALGDRSVEGQHGLHKDCQLVTTSRGGGWHLLSLRK